jgi:hypothetical protein
MSGGRHPLPFLWERVPRAKRVAGEGDLKPHFMTELRIDTGACYCARLPVACRPRVNTPLIRQEFSLKATRCFIYTLIPLFSLALENLTSHDACVGVATWQHRGHFVSQGHCEFLVRQFGRDREQ